MSDDLSTYKTITTSMQLRMRNSQSESGEGEERSEGVEQKEKESEGETKDVDGLEERLGEGDKRNSQTNRQGHELCFLWW